MQTTVNKINDSADADAADNGNTDTAVIPILWLFSFKNRQA